MKATNPPPTYNQAFKIIAKFGGEAAVATALGVARSTVYRWQYARPEGTDGLIPSTVIDRIKRQARLHGILLTDADWAPERTQQAPAPSTEAVPGLLTDAL